MIIRTTEDMGAEIKQTFKRWNDYINEDKKMDI